MILKLNNSFKGFILPLTDDTDNTDYIYNKIIIIIQVNYINEFICFLSTY